MQLREIQSLLPPTPLGDLLSRPLIHLQEKLHYSLCHNILHGRILAPGDVGPHLLKINHPHSLLQQGVFIGPVLTVPWLITKDPLIHPVVEYPQQAPNALGHDPSVLSIDKYSLYY